MVIKRGIKRRVLLITLMDLCFFWSTQIWANPTALSKTLSENLQPWATWGDKGIDGGLISTNEEAAEWDDTLIVFGREECVGDSGIAMSPLRSKECCDEKGVIKLDCGQTDLELALPLVDHAVQAGRAIEGLNQSIQSLSGTGTASVRTKDEPTADAIAEFAQGLQGQINAATADADKGKDQVSAKGGGPTPGTLFGFKVGDRLQGVAQSIGGVLGGFGLGGDLKTESSPQPGASAAASASGSTLSGTYTGAGQASQSGSGNPLAGRGNLFVEGSGSNTHSGAAGTTSHGDGGVSGVTALWSQDPDDYFARTDIQQSLFRQITRKMREKEPSLVTPK